VNRNFRLKQSTEFKRVRRSGKSYAHPFIVLFVLSTESERTLVGVAAGRTVGNAVQRNRAKRLVREAIRPLLGEIRPGLQVVLIARKPIIEARMPEIRVSLQELFARAHLFNDSNE
jgi:ribonuclease P protein component